MSKTIMLIHGAWLNSRSWEGFKARYEAQGYTVHAPDWPYDDRSPEELRASPREELKHLGQRDIIAHYEKLIRALPEEPILIGHSAGGVFVQHLLDRGLGVAGVIIDPAPTPGVPLGIHAIVSALPVFIDPFSWRKAKVMSRKFFANRFAQTAPRDQVDALYDRYIVPTPGQGLLGRRDQHDPDRLEEPQPRALAGDRRFGGPDRRRQHGEEDLEEAQPVAGTDRVQTISRPLALDRHRCGLGAGRR